jgi:hypothetical protein
LEDSSQSGLCRLCVDRRPYSLMDLGSPLTITESPFIHLWQSERFKATNTVAYSK